MEEVVKSFSTDVQQLEESVNAVLNSVNKYVSSTDSNLADNQKYVESFNKVLSNTKNGGADNQKKYLISYHHLLKLVPLKDPLQRSLLFRII